MTTNLQSGMRDCKQRCIDYFKAESVGFSGTMSATPIPAKSVRNNQQALAHLGERYYGASHIY